MKGSTLTALAATFILAGGLLPASIAEGQGRVSVLRSGDLARGSRIGVTVQDVEQADTKDAKAARAGVLIESVDTGGPAEKAGIKAGDTITEFDGERVRSVRQFSRLVQETPSGRTVALALSRDGQRVAVNVTTEQSGFHDDFSYRLLETMPRMATPPTPPAAPAPRALPALPLEGFSRITRGRLGVTLETLDDQLAQYFGVKDGVLVKSVAADSAAQKAGVKAGDVITSVNGRQVYDASDVTRALERATTAEEFTIEVMRDRKPVTLKGKIEAASRGRSSMMF
jgi:serine protease Do